MGYAVRNNETGNIESDVYAFRETAADFARFMNILYGTNDYKVIETEEFE